MCLEIYVKEIPVVIASADIPAYVVEFLVGNLINCRYFRLFVGIQVLLGTSPEFFL